ncbi:hypothetical protein ONZ45_g7834 [Pleurotus djamor]|nr:hypothetical protein ONZ45_g7834 [Pleurotus djamor]
MRRRPTTSQRRRLSVRLAAHYELMQVLKDGSALDDSDIQILKTYGQGPYASKIKSTEADIKEIQKRINEKLGVKESETGLASPNLWDLVADRVRMSEDHALQVARCTKIIPMDPVKAEAAKAVNPAGAAQGQKGADEQDQYVINLKQIAKFVVGLGDRVAPTDIDEGMRVGVDRTKYQIQIPLPPKIDASVTMMQVEEKPDVTYSDPERFVKLGIDPPKGVLLFGPPGTGKTLCARAVANRTDATFIRVIGSELVQKYVGEGARMVRELFEMARSKKACIIFFDEVDAIGGARFDDGAGGDNEVQRTMLELINQLDGFDPRGNIKVLMATNRPDTLDPALLRPGRLDRRVEFSLPDNEGRAHILRIHARSTWTSDTHVHRAPQPSSLEVTQLLSKYAAHTPMPINLATLLSFGRPLSPESVLSSAHYALSEIPRRLATRVRSLEALPFIVGTNPYIAKTLNAYRESFRLLATYNRVHDLEGNRRFVETLSELVQRHANDIPTMAKGFQECSRYMAPTQVSTFLDGAIRNRISVRLIAEQHIALYHAFVTSEEADPSCTGVIDMSLSPQKMVKMCGSFVSDLCEASLGVSPKIEISGDTGATFAYVPVHIEYILTEVLKNSFRATVEHHQRHHGSSSLHDLPPVQVTISSPLEFPSLPIDNHKFLSIRVRDRGGGVSQTDMARIFSYGFTTAGRKDDNTLENEDDPFTNGPYAAQYVGGSATTDGGGTW